MIIVGIDPGLTGAAAALQTADHEGPEFISDAIDLPNIEDGSKNQIDDFKFQAWLRLIGPHRVVIENVQPMPSIPGKGGIRRAMGVASSFRFGLAVGQLRASVRALGIDPEFCHPQTWSAYFDLKGDGKKEQSRQLALTFWPHAERLLRRKMDHGRAEAMLLAKWGARPLIGKNR